MKIYFGFAIADGMFNEIANVSRRSLDITDPETKKRIENAIPAINKFHTATVKAMKVRFGIEVNVPETPPKITLDIGDEMIVMSVRGLPRLTENRHYTGKEIANAEFSFGAWYVENHRKSSIYDLSEQTFDAI